MSTIAAATTVTATTVTAIGAAIAGLRWEWTQARIQGMGTPLDCQGVQDAYEALDALGVVHYDWDDGVVVRGVRGTLHVRVPGNGSNHLVGFCS